MVELRFVIVQGAVITDARFDAGGISHQGWASSFSE